MKTVLAVLTLCILAPGALAAMPECRSIESTSARLLCYDAKYPPKIEKPEIDRQDTRPAYRDPFVAEDAKTNAKLKNICRGC